MSYEMNAPVVASLDQLFVTAPRATPGCDVCAALLDQWHRLRGPRSPEYDLSAASDRAVEIRKCPNHPVSA
ncbi:hypothetical protein ACIBEA_39340 [Streptomyces sp. NPDC051555]|uniref:hypothetical protein n=1 Tax=Streptomyces sp. NPDC051555 TaxID=3365657 RepID=UPI0037B93526